MASGYDYNRVSLLLAVLEKRLGMHFSSQDVYINIAGGIRIDEPACDAATALALISSYKDIPVPDDLLVLGEIGLAGECRSISTLDQRLSKAARLGFKRAAVPFRNVERLKNKHGLEIMKIRSVYDLLKLLKTDK
jgi:DNA repair protein RadA/Sms